MALLTDNFFYISNPERFFSSLKKTIVLYLVKKFETFMVIFTSGRRCVFFKKRFCISASRTMHLTLNLQARHYRNINYYNIYICSFTQYYLNVNLVRVFPLITNLASFFSNTIFLNILVGSCAKIFMIFHFIRFFIHSEL